MEGNRHYPKAPIIEAIIDLRVQLPDGGTVAQLDNFGTEEQEGYPVKKNLNRIIGQMELGERLATSAAAQPIGYMFRAADDKQVFQAQLNGFTFSRLAPYDRWESFRDEARRLWGRYREVARPLKVLRVAVRFINRIDLPLPFGDFKEYLLTVPEVAPGVPQSLAGFFMQLNIPHEDIQSTLLLNETLTPPGQPDVCSVVLDIDLFRETDLPDDEEGLWDFFEVLHARKNRVFEACITDKTRELFK